MIGINIDIKANENWTRSLREIVCYEKLYYQLVLKQYDLLFCCFASWMISNLSMHHQKIPPQCRRKALAGNLIKKNLIPTKFEWLFRISQPAHFMTLVTSLYLAFLFFPRENRLAPEQPSTFTSLMYVACFAMHFGTQFWMTFASGLVLFFSLPRHIFGKVQKCLFPKYFMLNSLLSAITLALFILHHPSTAQGELKVQMWTLLICFLSEFGARLYIVPGLTGCNGRTHDAGRKRRGRHGSRIPQPRTSSLLSSLFQSQQALQDVPRHLCVRKHPLHGLQYPPPVLPVNETTICTDLDQ
ncbi:DUF4149 domain-containing protein [Caerostris darwini]|uniref:DUF4149 domain-containing protein n=1 Tax=Caerostris darwini TaxID=1538125 RepID=A0AAV4R4B3_9ARAC|nr:DUF4149 domain-containing protein [Caerostris darwini]